MWGQVLQSNILVRLLNLCVIARPDPDFPHRWLLVFEVCGYPLNTRIASDVLPRLQVVHLDVEFTPASCILVANVQFEGAERLLGMIISRVI